MDAITIRELQAMSAGTIAALPHAVPVTSGSATVALLVPVRKASPETVARVVEEIKEAAAERSPEEWTLMRSIIGEDH